MPSVPIREQDSLGERRSAWSVPAPVRTIWIAVPALMAFVLAAVFLWRSADISGAERAYPVVLAIAVLVAGVFNLVRDMVAHLRQKAHDDEERLAVGSTVVFIAVLVLALVLLEPVGFFPAMVVMVVGSLLTFDIRKPLVLAASTTLIVGCAFLVFVRLLQVPFPPGFLGLT